MLGLKGRRIEIIREYFAAHIDIEVQTGVGEVRQFREGDAHEMLAGFDGHFGDELAAGVSIVGVAFDDVI